LVVLFGPVAAYNLYFLGSFVLTGFTTYLLCYFVTRSGWASFLGGTIFAFVPFRSLHGASGHLNMLTTFWVPLYVLFLFKLFNKPGGRSALLCGVFLGLSVLSSPLIVAHAVMPITILFLIYQFVLKRRQLFDAKLLKCLGMVAGVALVLVLPFYYPTLAVMIRGQSIYLMQTGSVRYSADLLSFVVPFQGQFLVTTLRPVQDLVWRLIPEELTPENVAYMGLIPLLLACVGVWRMRRRAAFWLAVALVTGILSLGPLLWVGGRLVEYSCKEATCRVALPGAILASLPLGDWIRGPSRFSVTTALCLAVLASGGLSAVLDTGVRSRVRVGVTGGLVALILLEYAVYFPFPVEEAAVPDFYRILAGDGGDYGVLDISETAFNHRGMYYQTVHEHGIVTGYAYRFPLEATGLQRFFQGLVNLQGEIFSYDMVTMLRQLGIKYVVLHKDLETDVESWRPFLAERLGGSVYEDQSIIAFGVPPSEAADGGGIPLLGLGEQWHSLEYINGVPARWMVNDATLYVRAETEGSYQLALVAHPFRVSRHLQIFVNDELVEEYDVGGLQDYLTPSFVLKSDRWSIIRFHVPEGCEVPSQVMEGQEDPRCLSMLFQALDVLPAEAEA
jgi:hypothetical protein